MAEKRKFNRVSLSVGGTPEAPILVQSEEEVARNYDAEELYAQRVEAAKEENEKAELERLIKQSAEEDALDRNVKLMSPMRMVLRRFFRSKLSIVGLVMVIGLFVFSFLGPVFYTAWGETELDESGSTKYTETTIDVTDADGNKYEIKQTIEKPYKYNSFASPSSDHLLGTDNQGYDIFVRLMYGGRISLIVSFLAVFIITLLGVVLGGIAGYFGGWVDNVIMRICDILMCLPGIPILLIVGTIIDGWAKNNPDIPIQDYRIYILMAFLSLISWTGTARLVRGQILSLREQEYMVAAEAMGYSTGRKIFKHLIPNVMPQLIVQMTLSLGSMILYEATLSYLNLGVRAPYAAWGTMINIISTDMDILQNHFNIWGPAGICIVIAVLGFNFVGDGLRDALDPKMRR